MSDIIASVSKAVHILLSLSTKRSMETEKPIIQLLEKKKISVSEREIVSLRVTLFPNMGNQVNDPHRSQFLSKAKTFASLS
jgi:hypothetical protein